MKRRNAEPGKMRRPLKRTKITEGMYGNSMLYLKFVMLWATVVMADYILEFRFEFLWPFWMMLRSVYDSFKYQGLAFSVFFICIALTSDLICYFFIPLQYIFFAASTYVWVQYVWYTFADKGICVPTVAICCVVVYVESLVRGERGGELCRPLAAHCVGYPVVTLGFGVKSYVHHRLRLRTQRRVRQENEFYFQLMRDALPESALEQNQQVPPKESASTTSVGVSVGVSECTQTQGATASTNTSGGAQAHDSRQLNGTAVRRKCKPEANGHCNNGQEHAQLQIKLDKLEKHLAQQTMARDKAQVAQPQSQAHAQTQAQASNAHAHQNGSVPHGGHAAHDEDDKHDHTKGSAKSSKYEKKEASTLKEEKRRNKNRDKDKENADSHKSTEHTKEQLFKEVESTKEVKTKECNREREKEKERETREREKEKERERERERELREARECVEELKRTKAELAAVRNSEAEAKRALQAAAAADRQRRADHQQLKQAHATLQHKVSVWRAGERATLERRLGEERRARSAAEHQLLRARNNANRTPNGECENEWCKSRRSTQEAEAAALRRDLQRARDRVAQLQRDLTQATEQVRTLEARQEQSNSNENAIGGLGRWQALAEKALHLERSLSAETRVKLDLLSALGDANRKMHIQEGLITRQEKEIEELKAQMLAVMPSEYVGVGGVCSLRVPDSPLDPNASVYTPAQLCSDA